MQIVAISATPEATRYIVDLGDGKSQIVDVAAGRVYAPICSDVALKLGGPWAEQILPLEDLSAVGEIKVWLDLLGVKHLSGQHDQAAHGRGPQFRSVTSKLETAARRSEPDLTASLADLATKHGGELVGLEKRLKEHKSLTDKLHKTLRDMPVTSENAVDQIGDAVRYTMQLPADAYVGGVQGVLASLRRDGVTAFADQGLKNYWAKGDGSYVGVNSALVDRHGTRFELQFHTPESIAAKQQNHPLYERQRKSKSPAVREKLVKRMQENASKVLRLSGIDSLVWED